MIRGITFAEQTFYSKDFAHYMNFFLAGGNGRTKGCAVTNDNTTVTIDKGYFVVHGRLMNVEDKEVIKPSQGFKSGYNRIVYEIDLSKENTITEFKQGAIKVLNNQSLIKQDLDNGGKIFQFPFCNFQWSGNAISNFKVEAPSLVLDDIMADFTANYEQVNNQFRQYFNNQNEQFQAWISQLQSVITNEKDQATQFIDEQKRKILSMVQELEGKNFARVQHNTVSVNTSSWNSTSGVYLKQVSVSGIISSDVVKVDVITTTSNYEKEQEEYGKIFKVESYNGGIKLYAINPIGISLNLTLEVVR